jgi:hypothetical protein
MWFLLGLGVGIRVLGQFSFFGESVDIFLRSFSLVINSLAFIYMINIFKLDKNNTFGVKTSYCLYVAEVGITMFLSLIIFNNSLLLLFYNAIVTLRGAFLSILYKRAYFAVSCFLASVYFLGAFCTVYVTNTLASSLWLIIMISIVFAGVGTYVNGGKHN